MVNDHGARGASHLSGLPREIPLVAFSHLRWDFVRQRPQHLLSRFARERDVWMWEEVIPCDHHLPFLEYHRFEADALTALRPRVPRAWPSDRQAAALRELYGLFRQQTLRRAPIAWFYTPAMLDVPPADDSVLTVYDCMDELSAFAHADPALLTLESRLLDRADVVFTGGRSLYEAKRHRHGNVHPFPSAVDRDHFAAARDLSARDPDNRTAGYFGVIDERLDLALVAALADAMPDWRIEMVGPVVKIDPATLPQRGNIAWPGGRDYADLPGTLARWNVALMPFALNEATRFISPTKTPEYLAGGRPVVSTPIADVVADWGASPGVAIAEDAAGFARAIAAAATLPPEGAWLAAVDEQLDAISWDRTHARMGELMAAAWHARDETPDAAP